MPISDAHKCIFVHVPKTGGQTIMQLLELWYDSEKASETLFGWEGELELTHLSASQIRERRPIEFASYFKFAFVRHPLDRLVSEYAFSKAGPYRPYLPAYGLSFQDFVRGVQIILESDLARLLPHGVLNHVYPQAQFVFDDEGNQIVDMVARFESFEHAVLSIMPHLGINVGPNIIPMVNKSEHADYRDYYDAQTEAIVRDLYREDFERFGYK